MPETLFALDESNYRNCQTLYRGERKREYYDGEFWIDDALPVNVQALKCECGPFTIIETSAATRQFFRRTQKHIREDATDLTVLWFVRKGQLKYSNQSGQTAVGPGEFLLTRSMSPFFIELQPGEEGLHEILHVTLPTHLMRPHLAAEVTTSASLGRDCREVAIAHRLLREVFEDDGALSQASSLIAVDAACRLVASALGQAARPAGLKRTVGEQRQVEVLRFIEVHLSDPNLCMAMVSKGCDVSQRYLSLLLQGTGQTFSELVWSKRLDMARDWLSRSDPRDISISEIAYGVGFKSTAHFSRKFKQVFGVNPRDFRESCALSHGIAAESCGAGPDDLRSATLQ
jgi:AraC-like DNA-binding protein